MAVMESPAGLLSTTEQQSMAVLRSTAGCLNRLELPVDLADLSIQSVSAETFTLVDPDIQTRRVWWSGNQGRSGSLLQTIPLYTEISQNHWHLQYFYRAAKHSGTGKHGTAAKHSRAARHSSNATHEGVTQHSKGDKHGRIACLPVCRLELLE